MTRLTVWLSVAAIVISVFASAVPFKFTSRIDDARIAAAKADIENLTAGLNAFRADAKHYPTTSEGFAVLSSAPPGAQNWHGPYLGKPIVNDPWGHPYIYRCPGTHNINGFDLLSVGRDGQEGTSDDIRNW